MKKTGDMASSNSEHVREVRVQEHAVMKLRSLFKLQHLITLKSSYKCNVTEIRPPGDQCDSLATRATPVRRM